MNENVAERPRWLWIALALAAVSALIGLNVEGARWFGDLYDDAYIYLHYAQRTLDGCFLEWNCNEGRVEGFTSPLYLTLLTLGGALFDLEYLASMLGIIAWSAGIAAIILLVGATRQELSTGGRVGVGLALALAVASDQLLAINMMSGMEGGLVLVGLALLAWAACTESKRLHAAAPFLVLIRPELGLATIFQPLLDRFDFKRAALWAIGVFGAITLVRVLVFHDVLPNTFWAKSGGAEEHLSAGLKYLAGSYLRFPLAASVVLGLFSSFKPNRYLAAIVLAWSAYFMWSGGDFYLYARLFVFLAPIAYFVGLTTLVEFLERFTGRAPLASVSAIALAIVTTVSWPMFRDTYSPGHDNVDRWAETGRYIKRCMPGASIAAVPVGAIAYFSAAPVHDLVGLTDARLAKTPNRGRGQDFVVGHEAYDAAYSLNRAPGVIFFDVAGEKPFSRNDQVKLRFLAERELLSAVIERRAPYLQISPEVSSGVFQFLFVRRDVLLAAAEHGPEGCF